jgi:cytochrome c oxidase subunit IV
MSNHSHSPSYKSDVITFLILMVLTVITIWASYATGGTSTLAVSVAMTIATIKATFVVRNFMHIKYDHIIYKIFIGVVILLFLSFIILLAIDYGLR